MTTAKHHDAYALTRVALEDATKNSLDGVVLDVRGNRGGMRIEEFVALFTTTETLFIKRSRTKEEPVERPPRVKKIAPSVRIAVLVDARTASAAEMISAALQWHAGARVFGEPTAGAMTYPGARIELDADGDLCLFHPRHVVVHPRSLQQTLRVSPDELIPSPTVDDVRAGRDPALEAAVAWIRGP